MKKLLTAIGVAGLLLAGPANATVIYDTITGQTENGGTRDSLRPVASASRGPIGGSFTTLSDEWLTSVTVRLRNVSTNGVGDTGAVLVYLVPGTGTGVANGPSVVSGVTLASSKVLLGQINDTAVAFAGTTLNLPSAFANVGLTTAAFLNANTTYWLELVDAADSLNGTGNPVGTFLKWGINSDVAGVGVPTGANTIFSVANTTNTGLTAFNRTNNTNAAAGEVFEMQLQVPEPASVALLGVALSALGFCRRNRNNAG